MLSEGKVQTTQASELLAQVCRQFQERAGAQPELGIAVEWSPTRGSVDFGWGRCTLEASPDVLACGSRPIKPTMSSVCKNCSPGTSRVTARAIS